MPKENQPGSDVAPVSTPLIPEPGPVADRTIQPPSVPQSFQSAPVMVHREPVPIDVYYIAQGEDRITTEYRDGRPPTYVNTPYTALCVRQDRAYIDQDQRATLTDGSAVLEFGPGIPGKYGRPPLMGQTR